jgi:hypothetical protein
VIQVLLISTQRAMRTVRLGTRASARCCAYRAQQKTVSLQTGFMVTHSLASQMKSSKVTFNGTPDARPRTPAGQWANRTMPLVWKIIVPSYAMVFGMTGRVLTTCTALVSTPFLSLRQSPHAYQPRNPPQFRHWYRHAHLQWSRLLSHQIPRQ